jgi:hypothetical protein
MRLRKYGAVSCPLFVYCSVMVAQVFIRKLRFTAFPGGKKWVHSGREAIGIISNNDLCMSEISTDQIPHHFWLCCAVQAFIP